MPGWLIVAMIFAAGALILGVIAFFMRGRMEEEEVERPRMRGARVASYEEPEPEYRMVKGDPHELFGPVRAVAFVCLGLALLFTAISSVHTVPTRNVGIVTEFNKHTGKTTGAGFQVTWPWQKVEDWDSSRQYFDHLNEQTCVQVRITGLQTACLEVRVEWETIAKEAPNQWASFRKDFKFFEKNRVNGNFTDSLNAVWREHDPIANVNKDTAVITPVDTRQYIEPFKAEVNKRIGDDVKVISVTFGFIHYNDATQKTIEQFQSKVMEARNLEQDLKNAETRRQITEKNKQRDPLTWCLEQAEKNGKEPGYCFGPPQPVRPVQ